MRCRCRRRRWMFLLPTATAAAALVVRGVASMSSSAAGTTAARPARVAIVGGGAAGLAALRVLSRDNDDHAEIVCFEQNPSIAGVWNYRAGSTTSPMYAGLRTNLPKELMAFREYPWTTNDDSNNNDATPPSSSSFVTHRQVQRYLHRYAELFALHQYIRTGCRVTQLTCVPDSRSRVSPRGGEEDWPRIRLEWSSSSGSTEQQQQQYSDVFDAVVVCNGHYNLPAVPRIPGLEEYFKGETLHSIAYDDPQQFANQTVLCVGGRASGSDLARELSQVDGTTVYLSDTTFAGAAPITQHNVTWVPATTAVLPDGRVAFDTTQLKTTAAGGDAAETTCPPVHVDTIIFCSGYDYHFPFINRFSNLELDTDRRRVRPLYEQLWHATAPNVAFVGLPHSVVPFPLFELQSEAVARSWRRAGTTADDNNNNWQLPPLPERTAAAARDAESGGDTHGRVPEDTHFLGPAQWDYGRRMAKYAGLLNDKLENYIATQEAIYNDAGNARKGEFPAGPDTYRSLCYKRRDEERSFERWMLVPAESSSAAGATAAAAESSTG